jgi:hypothetical protein
VDVAQTVEAEAADYFLLEAFVEVGAFFGPDEHVDFIDAAQGVEDFL